MAFVRVWDFTGTLEKRPQAGEGMGVRGTKPRCYKSLAADEARPGTATGSLFKWRKNMRRIILVGLMVSVGGSVLAQQPYAGMQARPIKSLSQQQIADLQEGKGMGLALAAELNGYPGPSHAIELAAHLGLSPDQIGKLKELFAEMKAETVPIGVRLISQERGLNDDFENRTVTLASLEGTTRSIGETQATLRAAHLKYHLLTVAVLTAPQVKSYDELRGYGGAQIDHQHGRR